jgi:hypothetical protein
LDEPPQTVVTVAEYCAGEKEGATEILSLIDAMFAYLHPNMRDDLTLVVIPDLTAFVLL